MSSVDILAVSVAVGCHTDVVTVTDTLGCARDTSQADGCVMSPWINDSCNSRRQTSGKWHLRTCKRAVLKAVLLNAARALALAGLQTSCRVKSVVPIVSTAVTM